ncbi:conserved hypothetical protein [Frankia canadensis]|uniref:Lantibiotic dehydratase n=1 Tax=Frankia canadensis TaxID=1836972 RepID=A0A2I2KLQ9_9ACTN|nr:lantibiotic dehydratase [Frankia canadensis]SNQ46605.1 conserved hypothetical protein [Frankia canadensis]SOU53895.1 conserved hypothetical protein [Frankia canadensis]
MRSPNDRRPYRCADAALLRAAVRTEATLPAWPDPNDMGADRVDRWCAWLRRVWADEDVAAAVELASPGLARAVQVTCAAADPDARRVRRVVLATCRYLLRMTGRATPFGLFAGVVPASFGADLVVRWGYEHLAAAYADGAWLDEVISQLESCQPLAGRLPLVINNAVFPRGRRLVVPHQYGDRRTGSGGGAPAEVTLRLTPAVRLVVEAARAPICGEELSAKLAAEFPEASSGLIAVLLNELVRWRVLVSGLRAPSTTVDAFGYVVDRLAAVGAGGIPEVSDTFERLSEIRRILASHRQASTSKEARRVRADAGVRMGVLGASERPPVAVDLRLDGAAVLPRQVAREVESAAAVLARMARLPGGPVAWQDFHSRFFERYGIGAAVPLLDAVDADSGLGFPAGYPGQRAKPVDSPTPVSDRDRRLLAVAHQAALDGRQEIALTEDLIADLEVDAQASARTPAHLEMCFELHADSKEAVDRGAFRVAVVSVSRAAGTMTGRFLGLLAGDGTPLATVLADLPVSDPGAEPVQLSVDVPDPRASQVTRVPQVMPRVIALAEHRDPADTVIRLEDLALVTDGVRLSLVSLSRGWRLEPTMVHALDLRAHTPPLARFLAEISRSQDAVVTGFDWGLAADLPFLPRLIYGRAVLSPARWVVQAGELLDRGASWPVWEAAWAGWQARRRVPDVVSVGAGDRQLRLDLRQAAHRALLREHVDRSGSARLVEAAPAGAFGWLEGHAHEIVVLLLADQAARGPERRLAQATSPMPRVIRRDHGHRPGMSSWLYVKLYGHPDRQTEVLGEHLPDLLAIWDAPPRWWFIRYRDPDRQAHIRLRVALPDAAAFGPAATRVSAWADRLATQGLLRDVEFATYRPEIGRWGDGDLMTAAEKVFAADSEALLAQFAQPHRPSAEALAAAHIVAIAVGFTGGPDDGATWLIRHARPTKPAKPPRELLAEAVRLADPHDDWAALRGTPGGADIVEAWWDRTTALADYRTLLADSASMDLDATLVALLHAHHIRALGIDPDRERTCLHLARAAALSWRVRSATAGRNAR